MKKILLFIIVLLTITGCNRNKTLKCSKDISENEIKMHQTSNMSYVNDKLETIDISILVTIPDSYKAYMESSINNFKEQYSKLYEGNSHITFSVNKKNDSEIVIDVSADYKNMTEEEKKKLDFNSSDDYDINKKQLIQSGYQCE